MKKSMISSLGVLLIGMSLTSNVHAAENNIDALQTAETVETTAPEAIAPNEISAAPAFAYYGQEMWVQLGSPIPENWVVIQSTGTMNKIMYVGGASYGREVWVMLGSPIPQGWVVIQSSGSMNKLMYVNGASYGREVWVMLGSPIPQGWVVVRSSGSMNLIRYTG